MYNRTTAKHASGAVPESSVSPPKRQKTQRRRSISWADKTRIYQQEDVSERFNDYTKDDVTYSKEEYKSFRMDCLLSIQCLRASGGNLSVFDPDCVCFRGLEPFNTEATQAELVSRRKFNHSVVFQEQIRQRLFGISDPTRWQVLLTEQAEAALRRAQDRASVDQHEVYNEEFFRDSSSQMSHYLEKSLPLDDSNTLSLFELAKEIQEVQEEWDMRNRLMDFFQLSALDIHNDSQTTNSTGTVLVAEVAARNARLQQYLSLRQQQFGGMAA